MLSSRQTPGPRAARRTAHAHPQRARISSQGCPRGGHDLGPRTTLHRSVQCSRAHPQRARLGRGRAGQAGGGGGRSGSGVRGWCAARAARRRVQQGAEVVLAAGTLWDRGCKVRHSVLCFGLGPVHHAARSALLAHTRSGRRGCPRGGHALGPRIPRCTALHALRSARAPHS
jgi:hypothetical protein